MATWVRLIGVVAGFTLVVGIIVSIVSNKIVDRDHVLRQMRLQQFRDAVELRRQQANVSNNN